MEPTGQIKQRVLRNDGDDEGINRGLGNGTSLHRNGVSLARETRRRGGGDQNGEFKYTEEEWRGCER